MSILEYYSVIFISFIVGIILQMYPYLKYRYPGSNDIIYHIKRTRNPKEGFDIVGYPNLFHYLTAAVSGKLTRLNERQILKFGVVFEVITAFLFLILASFIFPLSIIAMAFPLIMTSPIFTYHAHTFSPRMLGIWFFDLAILMYLFPYPLCLFSVIFVALVALTHRMSMQTLFFTTIVLGFINSFIWFEFVIGVVIAIVFSKGYYLTILKSHIQFIKLYYREPHLPNNELKGMIISPSNASVFIILGVYILNLFGYSVSIFIDPQMQFLFLWAIVPISLVVLWRMGLSFQHAAFAVVPSSLLFAYLIFQSIWFNILYYVVLSISVVLSLLYVKKVEYLEPSVEELLRYLSKIENVVLCAPNTLKRKAPYFSGAYTYHYDDLHFNKENLLELFKKNHITHLLIRKNLAESLENFKVIKESGNWAILEYNGEE